MSGKSNPNALHSFLLRVIGFGMFGCRVLFFSGVRLANNARVLGFRGELASKDARFDL